MVALSVHVNPQMVTNSFWKRGFPKWDFFLLPTHFRTGVPCVEMGIVVSANL